MGCPVVHWELCEDVEAEFAAGGRVAECLSSRACVSVPCHPERATCDGVAEGEAASESRDPLKSESHPCSTLSGEVGGSFDSAAGRPRSG